MNKYLCTDGKDIDDILADWAFSPEIALARLVRASDGRYVLQMRVELGVLQLEVNHRPDGMTPFGFKTYLGYLKHLAAKQGGCFVLQQEHWEEAVRELRQFHQRRICWLALGRYSGVIRDADHTLDLMKFLQTHVAKESKKASPDLKNIRQLCSDNAHELDYPLVLFQRAQAVAMIALDEHGSVRAVEEIDAGIKRLRKFSEKNDIYFCGEKDYKGEKRGCTDFLQTIDWKVGQLLDLKLRIQSQYGMTPSLEERLQEAVRKEDYELAARIHNLICKYHAEEKHEDTILESVAETGEFGTSNDEGKFEQNFNEGKISHKVGKSPLP